MKTKLEFPLKAILMILSIAVVSCEGPEGPQGLKGDKGDPGLQGTQGPTGPVGNVNFISSEWIGNIQWSKHESPPVHKYFYQHNEPKIDLELIDHGLVMVYYRTQPNSTPAALPTMTYAVDQTGKPIEFGFFLEFRLYPLKLEIFHSLSPKYSQLGGIDKLFPNSQFRYFLIPGSANGRMDLPDWEDYQAVCEFFGVEP